MDRGTLEDNLGQRKACRFKRSLLGVCSGLENPQYGFDTGKPCIIVKLNRIVNFRPKVGERIPRCGHMTQNMSQSLNVLTFYSFIGVLEL